MTSTERDSELVRSISFGCAVFSTLFAIAMACLGHLLTSKQWTFLMQIPGGKWAWAVLFGTAGLTALYGLIEHRQILAAVGLFLGADWCLSIALFYMVGPLFESSLFTLGYFPWVGMGILGIYMMILTINEARAAKALGGDSDDGT